uniref:Uncharacterized protein n=1 Tax=Podoviridae sp. ctrTt13 TaxID=2825279 RepID=A0A8S5NU78_9CAUD|nr:MAG TPA: hypothetical protein [Podoviridae sp. ctrTt13]
MLAIGSRKESFRPNVSVEATMCVINVCTRSIREARTGFVYMY